MVSVNTVASRPASYASGKTASSTCPHGGIPGACEYCNGGGGGGGGGSKPVRRAGLFTWNEALALFNALKYAKQQSDDDTAAFQAKLAQNAAQSRQADYRSFTALPFASRLAQTLTTSLSSMINRIFALSNTNQTGKSALEKTPSEIMLGKVQQAMTKVVDISEKLVAIFGEEIRLLRDRLATRLDRLRKAIVALILSQGSIVISELRDRFLSGLNQTLDVIQTQVTAVLTWLGLMSSADKKKVLEDSSQPLPKLGLSHKG